MNSLPIPLYLAVKDCVFVLGQHFLLSGHLYLPAIDPLHVQARPRQGIVKRRNNAVYVSEALALSVLLVAGQAPGDFPGEILVSDMSPLQPRGPTRAHWRAGGIAHQSRPPDSGFVRRKGPNIVDVRVRDAGGRVSEDAKDSRGLAWRASLLS